MDYTSIVALWAVIIILWLSVALVPFGLYKERYVDFHIKVVSVLVGIGIVIFAIALGSHLPTVFSDIFMFGLPVAASLFVATSVIYLMSDGLGITRSMIITTCIIVVLITFLSFCLIADINAPYNYVKFKKEQLK